MVFVLVYDANELYPSTLRDLLVHVALTPWGRSRTDPSGYWLASDPTWTPSGSRGPGAHGHLGQELLGDGLRATHRGHRSPRPGRPTRRCGHRPRAQVIITFNLEDFPAAALNALDVAQLRIRSLS